MKNSSIESGDGYSYNRDTGLVVFDAFKWVQKYYDSNSIIPIVRMLEVAFENRILIQIADFGMPNGYRDVSNLITFIKNMGYTPKKIWPFSKAFYPWQNSEILSLVSWEPGANVDPFGNWCDWAKNSKCKDRPEHIDEQYWAAFKYDASHYIDDHPEWDGYDVSDMPQTKNWQEVRNTKGLYQFEDGRRLTYQEKQGFMFDDKLVDQNVCLIKEAPETMTSSVEEKRRRGRKRKK